MAVESPVAALKTPERENHLPFLAFQVHCPVEYSFPVNKQCKVLFDFMVFFPENVRKNRKIWNKNQENAFMNNITKLFSFQPIFFTFSRFFFVVIYDKLFTSFKIENLYQYLLLHFLHTIRCLDL